MSLSKSSKAEPVSRFWACFFSTDVIALFWTHKMKKTRKWILLYLFCIGLHCLRILVLEPIYALGLEGSTIFIPTVLLGFLFLGFTITLMVYFMLQWTTQYNLDNFGYRSKKDWKKAKSIS